MDKDLKPLVIFSEIFNLRVFKSVKNRTICFEKKKRDIFYWFRLISYVTAVIFAIVYKQYVKTTETSKNVIISFVKTAQLNCRVPLVVICLFFVHSQSGTIVKFLNSASESNANIVAIGGKINHKCVKVTSYVLMFINFFKILVQVTPYLMSEKWTLIDYMDCLIYTLPDFLIYCTTMQWISLLNILRLQFQALNELLEKLEPINFTVLYEISTNRRRRVLATNRNTHCRETSRIIENLPQIYNKLYNQANQIIQAYHWQILFILTSLFLWTIYDSFIICQMIKHTVDFNIKNLIMGGLHLLAFLELTVPCSMVKEEVDKMVNILHGINLNGNMDLDVYNEMIDVIALQTHHQDINFSIFDALHLDGSLIYSVFGALTTYLVILLQFDI